MNEREEVKWWIQRKVKLNCFHSFFHEQYFSKKFLWKKKFSLKYNAIEKNSVQAQVGRFSHKHSGRDKKKYGKSSRWKNFRIQNRPKGNKREVWQEKCSERSDFRILSLARFSYERRMSVEKRKEGVKNILWEENKGRVLF